MPELFVGLMSGTSLDGIDAVLVDFAPASGSKLQVIGHHHRAFDDGLRRSLLALNRAGADELHRSALAANALATAYAEAVQALLRDCGTAPSAIRAIGAHGQTVRHQPGEFDRTGYTLQLLNGALLAELCGIDTVCDFRSRDVAAGGQGAPLVPAFHAELFHRPGVPQALLNFGGIGNLTLLSGDGSVTGFDCGPGNALLDLWCERHLGQAFDDDGRWAAGGRADEDLLAMMLAEPFFKRPPPKSTGRDLFHADWLDSAISRCAHGSTISSRDVMATLAELTVRSAVVALRDHLPECRRLLVCGGGASNGYLMSRLHALLSPMPVQSTLIEGLPPQQVEATAFAWLARAFTNRQPASRPAVTGARGPRILGALYLAS